MYFKHNVFYRGKNITTKWDLIKFIKLQLTKNISDDIIITSSKTSGKTSTKNYTLNIDMLKLNLELSKIRSGLKSCDQKYLDVCNLVKEEQINDLDQFIC